MFSSLSRREQDVVSVGSVAVILFILIQFILLPTLDKRQSFINKVNAKKDALKEMVELESRYQEIQSSVMAEKILVMKRDKSFTLFSFLDRLAQESNVKDNVSYMKPFKRQSENSEVAFSSVKVKLDEVVMRQVVDFIYKIESSNNLVYISSLSLSRTGENGQLSAIIEAETIVAPEN
ncbi:MAG: type II secretion system protein M [Desulfamplus sp.]|nr:type II secretion system protein M [Desulfamplus sp.]